MKKITLVCFICFLICGCNKEVEYKENDIVNINHDVIKTQIVDNFEFNDISVIYSGGLTNVRVVMKNTNDDKYIEEVMLIFKSKNDKIIKEYNIPVKKNIKKNEEQIITMSTDIDLTNAYKIVYELK